MTTPVEKNPRGVSPATQTGLGELGFKASRTLVEQLGAVADDLRQLHTDFGMRPYTLHAIRIRWTGGEIGRGEDVVVFDEPLLPTPKTDGISSMTRTSTNAGGEERGDVRVSQISPLYTEDQIQRYFAPELRKDEEGFIEIRVDSRDGVTARKRFVVEGTPERRPGRFDWTVVLRKQDENRARRL